MVDESRLFSHRREVEDEGDVAHEKGGSSAIGKRVFGKGGVLSAGDEGDKASGRGSMRKLAGEQLMLERTGNSDRLEDFESRVEDSLEGLVKSGGHGSNLGYFNHNSIRPCTGAMGQSREVLLGHDNILGQSMLGNNFNPAKELGHLCPTSSDNIESSPEIRAVNLGDDNEAAVVESNHGTIEANGPSVLLCLSQDPGTNISVDLSDAGCRRRRRRKQFSNLLTLHEMEENKQEVVPDSLSSEDEDNQEVVPDSLSSENDTIQNDSTVEGEVLATMAVGGALGINFQPNSAAMLKTMIEMEAAEYSRELVREAER